MPTYLKYNIKYSFLHFDFRSDPDPWKKYRFFIPVFNTSIKKILSRTLHLAQWRDDKHFPYLEHVSVKEERAQLVLQKAEPDETSHVAESVQSHVRGSALAWRVESLLSRLEKNLLSTEWCCPRWPTSKITDVPRGKLLLWQTAHGYVQEGVTRPKLLNQTILSNK